MVIRQPRGCCVIQVEAQATLSDLCVGFGKDIRVVHHACTWDTPFNAERMGAFIADKFG